MTMKPQRALAALTVVNLVLLAVLLARARPAGAHDEAPVLRGSALEIVDRAGKVRASIRVYPANPDVQMPDAKKGYPETVLLRLITGDGRPSVKLSASERGGILVLGGESNPTYAQLMGDDGKASLTLSGKDGQRHTIER
jgi:hypothetical protein